jgi:hypothetical protein
MEQKKGYISFEGAHLGSVLFTPGDFSKDSYSEFESPEFKKLPIIQKHDKISRVLFEAIQKEQGEVFLLPKVISFISLVRTYLETYHLTSFEFWLNGQVDISEEEKLVIRGKIVGKVIPRSEYQNFFPLQNGAYSKGSHYSYGHISPDLDTTVASFACFLAAFGAKVGEHRHHWVLPGGPPQDVMEIEFFFKKALGKEVFTAIGSSSTKFLISALDLISQTNIHKKQGATLTYNIDTDRGREAVILVDERGCYLGDWRPVDVDPVRSIIDRFRGFLAEYQYKFAVSLVSLFSRETVDCEQWTQFLNSQFQNKFSEALCARELIEKQKKLLDKFMKEVLFIGNGLYATMGEFFEVAKSFGFAEFQERLESLKESSFFDRRGELTENRALIFKKLEEIFLLEKEAFARFFQYIDSLEAAMEVKKKVLERESNFISHLAEYDEIAEAMKDYNYLTVNYQENGDHYPLGVVYAEDVKRKVIATTSWNDFSNPNETDFKEGVELISYIDHHKSNLVTPRPAFGMVRGDAQSSNSMVARINFEINDRYSTGGMSLEEIEKEIGKLASKLDSKMNVRLLQRLLRKKNVALTKGELYVSSERECLEYLQYIFAILDDTDLLTKVTEYDVDTMAGLLNRLKSIMKRQEVEVVDFDDLCRKDIDFPKKAAKKLMQTPDLYSLYGAIYKAKEEAIDVLIKETGAGVETHFFQDTKILGSGGYAAVGQFKHFVKNEKNLRSQISGIRNAFVQRSKNLYESKPDVLLHMLMLSTVASAEELFSDSFEKPNYSDELWFWIPNDKKAEHYLQNFLTEFIKSPKAEKQHFGVEFLGNSAIYERNFKYAFGHKSVHSKRVDAKFDMAILKVDLGSIKSRKSDIAAYL